MAICNYCEEQERESYWRSYCEDCAMLRRMLVLHNSKKCVEILRRCLIRNEQQITNKINLELKKEITLSDDQKDYEQKPITRSNKKDITKI
tara:strand:- start:149 stop:421 length:273 start_codon:yes stop_codon:yes gene_type:complete